MRRTLPLVLAGLICGAAGCAKPVDLAQASTSLLDTDRHWAQLADSGAPADSAVAYWSDDARVIMPGQATVVGKAALRQMVTGMMSVPGFHITWAPDSAVLSAAGDFGYTYGTNRVSAPDAKGKVVTTIGRYITVWRRDADGRWRCIADISNEGPSAAAAASKGTD